MKQPSEYEEERDGRAHERPPPAPQAPNLQAGSLEWASAVGNQAVQQLARQHAATEEEAPAVEPEQAPVEEAEPAEAEQPDEALAEGEAEALAAVDEDAETLPE
jgi:hypothetical protein